MAIPAGIEPMHILGGTAPLDVRKLAAHRQLDARYELDTEEYDMLLRGNAAVRFGTCNVVLDPDIIPGARAVREGAGRLYLKEIHNYHRIYAWAT